MLSMLKFWTFWSIFYEFFINWPIHGFVIADDLIFQLWQFFSNIFDLFVFCFKFLLIQWNFHRHFNVVASLKLLFAFNKVIFLLGQFVHFSRKSFAHFVVRKRATFWNKLFGMADQIVDFDFFLGEQWVILKQRQLLFGLFFLFLDLFKLLVEKVYLFHYLFIW